MKIKFDSIECEVEISSLTDFSLSSWRRGVFYEANKGGLLSFMYAAGVYQKKMVIDCGAHFGNHTLFFKRVLNCEVLAIEPIYQSQIKKTLMLNKIHDVRVIGAALSDGPGNVGFEIAAPGNSGSAYISGHGAIPKRSLDSIVSETGFHPDVIKVDVERSNLELLRGARETLTKFKPEIFIECATDFDDVNSVLVSLGYSYTGKVFNATPTYLFKHENKSGGSLDFVQRP